MHETIVRTNISFASSPDLYDKVGPIFDSMPHDRVVAILDGDARHDFGTLGYILQWWLRLPDPDPHGPAKWLAPQHQSPVNLQPFQTRFTIICPPHTLVRLAVAAQDEKGRMSPPVCVEFIARDMAPEVKSPGVWIDSVEVREIEVTPDTGDCTAGASPEKCCGGCGTDCQTKVGDEVAGGNGPTSGPRQPCGKSA